MAKTYHLATYAHPGQKLHRRALPTSRAAADYLRGLMTAAEFAPARAGLRDYAEGRTTLVSGCHFADPADQSTVYSYHVYPVEVEL